MTPGGPQLLQALLARKTLAVGLSLVAAAGGGRLVRDELHLASSGDAALVALTNEARRVGRLELDLAEARLVRRGLEEEVARVGSRATGLADEAARTRSAKAAAELQLARARDELSWSLGEVERLERARAAAEVAAAERARAVDAAHARELGEVRGEVAAAQATLAEAQRVVESLGAELTAARAAAEQRVRALRELTDRHDALAARAAGLEADLLQARRARADLEALAAETRSRADAAERERAELQARVRAADQTLERVGGAVNLARFDGRRPMPKVSALVVQVDLEATPPVVLVDAGAQAGVEVGDRLFVVRGGQSVAELEVDEVRPRLATTRLIRGQRGLRLRPGDEVGSQAPTRP